LVKAMRKVRTAKVVRVQMDKTAVVEMVWKQRNRLYRKQVRRVARFHVHDQLNQCQLGDVVRIEEVRPISKTKRWRLMEILERHVVAEVRPIELESDAEVLLAAEPLDEEGESAAPAGLAEDEGETTDDEPAADEDLDEAETTDDEPAADEDLDERETTDDEPAADEDLDEGETTDDEPVVDEDSEEDAAPAEEVEDDSLLDDEEIGEDDTPQGIEEEVEDKAGDEAPPEAEDEVK